MRYGLRFYFGVRRRTVRPQAHRSARSRISKADRRDAFGGRSAPDDDPQLPGRMAKIARLPFPVRVCPSGTCQSAAASPAVSQLPKREPSLRTPLTRWMPAANSGLNNPQSAASYANRRTASKLLEFLMRTGLEYLTSSICSAEDFAGKELNRLFGANIDSGILEAAEIVLGEPSALIEIADIVYGGAQCSKASDGRISVIILNARRSSAANCALVSRSTRPPERSDSS